MERFTVFGRPGCGFCVQAKKVLENKELPFRYVDIHEEGITAEDLETLRNSLKAVSSRRLRQEFCDIAGAYRKPVLWSRSYFAGSCGGAPLEVITEYIRNQDQP